MIRGALLILSALVAATAEAAEWQVSEGLIGEGARIEDSGTTLVEIRWVVPLGPDAFALWAKYGPERQQGGLYLWREGRPVTTVVLDGGTLSAPGSRASAKFIVDSSKWGRHTLRHPSGPRYFLSPLRAATGADVFALGADGIEKILAKGDRIPIGDNTAATGGDGSGIFLWDGSAICQLADEDFVRKLSGLEGTVKWGEIKPLSPRAGAVVPLWVQDKSELHYHILHATSAGVTALGGLGPEIEVPQAQVFTLLRYEVRPLPLSIGGNLLILYGLSEPGGEPPVYRFSAAAGPTLVEPGELINGVPLQNLWWADEHHALAIRGASVYRIEAKQ